jgi:two-component system, response regulator RegA
MTTPPSVRRSVLIVEDDERLRSRLARAFRDRGFDAREAADYDSALGAAREDSPEYLLVDLRMPGRSGLEVIRDVKALAPETTAVVLTGYGSIATAVEAVRLGAADYLTKPADVESILAAFAKSESCADPSAAADAEGAVPSLARVEWEHISRVVSDCGGNISKAARILRIHRRSLQRKLGKYPAPR